MTVKPINELTEEELSDLIFDRDGITAEVYDRAQRPSTEEINRVLAALENQ